MKFTALTASLLACSSLTSALISLSYVPTSDGRIRIGDSIRVKWTTDGTYVCNLFSFSSSSSSFVSVAKHKLTLPQDLSLNLNKIENEKWSTEKTAFENLRQQAGEGEFLFEIPGVKANK
jgi:hypothetical protein